MKTELLGQEKNIVTIKVEFEVEEFTESLNKTIQEVTQKINVPGFRKGHIPRKVLDMRFGRKRLYLESLEKMLPKAIDQILGDYDLETIDAPSLKTDEIREGEPLVCELTFEIVPEVSLPEFENIEAEKLRAKVTDKMLDDATDELKRLCSTLNPVERPIDERDVVSTTSLVFLVDSDENQPKENTPQENVFDLSAPNIRGEIKNALLGKTRGEKVSVEFIVDEAHQDKRMAGKKIHYDMTIDQIQERTPPTMGSEFSKQALGVDLDSEEAFREELEKRLLDSLNKENLDAAVNSALDQIIEKSELEVPDTLLNRQIEYQKQRDVELCAQRFGMSLEEYLRNASVSSDQYEREVRKQSMDIMRRTLVLDEIKKKFEIEVEPKDIEAEINRMALVHGTRPESIKAAYYKNQDQLKQLTEELRYVKIANLIQEKVKIKEVDALSAKTPQAAENLEKETSPAGLETTEGKE
ncbi:MAG: trigger factor [Synergistaceae bacterium]|jgi:trigger factor|nr:trigger factor [Synergistaceae bacterium]